MPSAKAADPVLSGAGDIFWYSGDMGLAPVAAQKPMIAIVLDDLGIDRKRSARAVKNLKAPVTLSYLAYAPHIQQQVDAAKAAGHEVILHLPWEPLSDKKNPGPNHISVDMTKEQMQKNLLKNLNGFKGYTGINNHMGSKFSRSRPGLEVVMAEVKKRGVYFLDSKTTPGSIAEKVAKEYGIPALHRDVFLDHESTPEFATSSLKELEATALKRGSAVAIGHPHDLTLAALEAWIPMIEAKGFQIVSLTTLMEYRKAAAANVAQK